MEDFLDFTRPEGLEIVISSNTLDKLNLKIGDYVNSFFYDFSKSKFPKKKDV